MPALDRTTLAASCRRVSQGALHVPDQPSNRGGDWHVPVTITGNNFGYKSPSNWACNCGIGCSHPCPELKRDGNRAGVFCRTTDPYQVIHRAVPYVHAKKTKPGS